MFSFQLKNQDVLASKTDIYFIMQCDISEETFFLVTQAKTKSQANFFLLKF